MTHEEMFNRIQGTMTKADAEMKDILNTYGSEMYHLGCIAGEQTIKEIEGDGKRVFKPMTELAQIIHTLYLNYVDEEHRHSTIDIQDISGEIIYSGPADSVPDDILEAPYTVWSIPMLSKRQSDAKGKIPLRTFVVREMSSL